MMPGTEAARREHADAVDSIHRGTAIYTAQPEIEALLDRMDWPKTGTQLLDPGAGNGGFLVSAISRLTLPMDDVDAVAHRVRGYEFHAGAVSEARDAVASHLRDRGWSSARSSEAATRVVENRDYLLSPVPVGVFDTIVANPPYWRYANLPEGYRAGYDEAVASHARPDLLYAYLQRSADIVAPGGRIGLITADRWLLNDGSAELRRRIGAMFTVVDVLRLESVSAFYRDKSRRKGTPARVHPVSLVLVPDRSGRQMTSEPFRIEELPEVAGTLLKDLVEIHLAPWLGPEGIFVVRNPSDFPEGSLVPCIEPDDVARDRDEILGVRRWAIATGQDEPHPDILAHLDAALDGMPNRGRRQIRWMPPESFSHKLPLQKDAVLVPRIALRLRPILLPAGVMPLNHNLVAVSGIPAPVLIEWLNHPVVQAQADALALRVESGYRSYTAGLLRRLVIPEELVRNL
jgi:hypothetical protein